MSIFEHIKSFFSNLFNKRKALPEATNIEEISTEIKQSEEIEISGHDKFTEKIKTKPVKKIAHKKLKYVETLRFGGDGLGIKKNVQY